MSTQAWNICATPHRGSIIVNVYLTSAFVFLASIAKANGISRRIASEREGLSFCCLAQLSVSQKSLPSRSAIKLAFFDNPLVRHAVEDSVMRFDCAAPAELFITKRKGGTQPSIGYRCFATTAEAIRFAIEDFPAIRTLGRGCR